MQDLFVIVIITAVMAAAFKCSQHSLEQYHRKNDYVEDDYVDDGQTVSVYCSGEDMCFEGKQSFIPDPDELCNTCGSMVGYDIV